MPWKEEYQHGLIWQDFQHKQLFDNIEILIESVTTGKNDPDLFRKTALFVIQYCNGHFKIEEEYMTKHGYSLADSHIQQHNDFIKGFNEMLKDKNINDLDKSNALLHKLLAWFTEHVITSDKLLANFLLRHGIK
jgi:hemerythrin